MFCEPCSMDPVEVYGSESATTCIAVHHAATQVADMHAVTMMRLEHLQCLCANCHRLVHQMLRDGTHVKKQGSSAAS